SILYNKTYIITYTIVNASSSPRRKNQEHGSNESERGTALVRKNGVPIYLRTPSLCHPVMQLHGISPFPDPRPGSRKENVDAKRRKEEPLLRKWSPYFVFPLPWLFTTAAYGGLKPPPA
ncbi:MAG TPA: hypothetical protein P5539_14180, partial [Mesotoga sp.]|nr:hypothetical protein [Mesotoga sp.]